ncbi:MAG TPA: peptidyl-prolyl cis-trans isomerase [Polyangia bacterium]|nr:peptidyl-prolyl cis-trans isomerase [Polyangia bacterium]HVZ47892.1 peptidyl-prolyl cis-trans isomerase [Gemmatimonadaceae bacterium]
MSTLPARLSSRLFPLRSPLGAALLVALCAAPACKKASIKPAQDKGDLSQVVAQVGDETITVGDVQERINKQSPFIRARYTTLDKKKEFLDNLVRFEVMAGEAQKRGYDKDPEVQRVMKQQMISKFLQKDFESTIKVEDVPDADVEKYYADHPEEFNKKDEVRVSEILVKDKAKADKAYAEAKAQAKGTPGAAADPNKFRDLVTKYSEDEESKARGGDLTFFDKDSTAYPKPVVEAAFSLKEVGDVSTPVKTDKGFVILKLTQKRPGFSRPLAEVKRQIQQRLFRDTRTKKLDAFIADLKKNTKIDIHEDNLGKVVIENGMETGGGAGGIPNPHGGVPSPHAMGAPGAALPQQRTMLQGQKP